MPLHSSPHQVTCLSLLISRLRRLRRRQGLLRGCRQRLESPGPRAWSGRAAATNPFAARSTASSAPHAVGGRGRGRPRAGTWSGRAAATPPAAARATAAAAPHAVGRRHGIAPNRISQLSSVCIDWTAEIDADVSLCVPSASAGSTPAARIHLRNVLYSFSDISQ